MLDMNMKEQPGAALPREAVARQVPFDAALENEPPPTQREAQSGPAFRFRDRRKRHRV
jgi:hypothetical protein